MDVIRKAEAKLGPTEFSCPHRAPPQVQVKGAKKHVRPVGTSFASSCMDVIHKAEAKLGPCLLNLCYNRKCWLEWVSTLLGSGAGKRSADETVSALGACESVGSLVRPRLFFLVELEQLP
jgi:hypothetical protein